MFPELPIGLVDVWGSKEQWPLQKVNALKDFVITECVITESLL